MCGSIICYPVQYIVNKSYRSELLDFIFLSYSIAYYDLISGDYLYAEGVKGHVDVF